MDKLFWVDEVKSMAKTYDDLVNDVNNIELSKYINDECPYIVFTKLIKSMATNNSVILFDSDFSEDEIKNLQLSDENITVECSCRFKTFDEILSAIKLNSDKWRIQLFTSGTTGRPKKVIHSLESLTRTVKTGEKFKDNVWGFAYNPTHFAGMQVFYQAFLNRNTMVYLFGVNRVNYEEILNKYSITNISATPTFYRNFLPFVKSKNTTIERITLGGEQFDSSVSEQLTKKFINARVINIYASTECGSLFNSKGEFFSIGTEMEGKIKISTDNELLIHESLVANIDSSLIDNGWYMTGDTVEFVSDVEFKFLSRKNEMINVGGYKVNPNEVEKAILQYDGIIDVLVKGRKNKVVGNMIVANIIITDLINESTIENDLFEFLRPKLQSWKIPRIIKVVSEIEKTRTGKKDRR
jgi:acyl-coenzyme A synthetase/AMP-(fatty) acid ligase